MNAVAFYSNTGQSRSVAEYFAEQLSYPIINIENSSDDHYENLVLVFPVHCQNVPDIVKAFLKTTKIKNLTVIATYGRMCCGNVLREIQNRYRQSIVAAAYVPTKHSYLAQDSAFSDYDKLRPIVEKIKTPAAIILPRLYKNPLANLFPKWRSRVGLKIFKNANCNGCNACGENCPLKAICEGVPSSECIRCLKCVTACPRHALEIKIRLPLKLYLRKKKSDQLIIYT
ncbi:MAG: EFR1 family ferrodoxin [Clostridia bacterium]|nr:EFR1 family ferrodoxin [Clostridia bacterium]